VARYGAGGGAPAGPAQAVASEVRVGGRVSASPPPGDAPSAKVARPAGGKAGGKGGGPADGPRGPGPAAGGGATAEPGLDPGHLLPPGATAEPGREGAQEDLPPAFAGARDQDRTRFGEAGERDIEALYAKGMDLTSDDGGLASLQKLVEEYPESNRAACAAQALAVQLAAEEKHAEVVKLLDPYVVAGTPAVYRNGRPVLVAMLRSWALSQEALQRPDAARVAWLRIVAQFPDEVDPMGRSYAEQARERL